MTARELLLALQAAGIPATGLSVSDLADPLTYRFFGLKADEHARAVALIGTLMAPAPASSSAVFWPAPDPLGDRITALEQKGP